MCVGACRAGAAAVAGWALDFVEDDSDSLLIGAVEVAGVVDRADIVARASGVSDTVSPAW